MLRPPMSFIHLQPRDCCLIRKILFAIKNHRNLFQRITLRLDKCEVYDDEHDYDENALDNIVLPGNILQTDGVNVLNLYRL